MNINKIMLVIELEPDNVELEKTTSAHANTLLRYGKILEGYMKKSQADIQTLDIADKVNNSLINKINDVQSTIINNVNNGLTNKWDSVNSLMSEKLTNISLQLKSNVSESVTDITSVLNRTDNVVKRMQDLFIDNNQSLGKTNQQLLEFNNDVNKELASLKSHVGTIIEKYNSKDNLDNLHKTLLSQMENLKLNIKDMINNNTTKDLFANITKDLQSQMSTMRVEMRSVTERLNMVNVASLIHSIIKSYFNELKLDLQNTTNLTKQVEGLNDEVRKLSQMNAENKPILNLQTHLDNRLADIKENFNAAMNKTSVKGIIGENKVMNILSTHTKGYDIKDMSKIGHQFDIHIFNNDYNICIECKNHGRNVPTEDMKRFVNNVANSVCDGVIIINHDYGFTNIVQDFVLTEKYGGKPVIFISRFSSYPLILPGAIKLLEMVIDLKKKGNNVSKQNNTSNLEFKIEQQNETIRNLESKQEKANVAIRKFTSNMIKQINDFSSTVLALL